jgi:group I intron endonuclease
VGLDIRISEKGCAGIYKITAPNGKCYVGSSKDMLFRARQHGSKLRSNKHTNQYLQNSFNKYGRLIFEPIYRCEASELEKWEQVFINELEPSFNVLRTAYSSRGYRHKDEDKKRMGKIVKARFKDPNYIKKLKPFGKGDANPTKKGQLSAGSKKVSRPVKARRGNKSIKFPSVAEAARYFEVSPRTIYRRTMGIVKSSLKGWLVTYD